MRHMQGEKFGNLSPICTAQLSGGVTITQNSEETERHGNQPEP